VARASIDIGSNSLLLLVVDEAGNTLHDESAIVRLGKGMGDQGRFADDRMEAGLEVLGRYAARARELGVPADQIRAVATSAGRRATNATEYFDAVRTQTGISVRVISGEEEAELTWTGALGGLPLPDAPIAVVDLGGGSTEVVVGRTAGISARRSLELGAVRLTERFFGDAPQRYDSAALASLRDFSRTTAAALQWPAQPQQLIGVAGTATTLGAMQQGLTVWDRERVHGTHLSRDALGDWIARLSDATPADRQAWAAVAPLRADYLLACACVLDAVCAAADCQDLLLSDGGVRHGLLL
jgi:exopolyphosphatase / guanosine-5'-triphosphate,3'-diphosphate pyrophosphatase